MSYGPCAPTASCLAHDRPAHRLPPSQALGANRPPPALPAAPLRAPRTKRPLRTMRL